MKKITCIIALAPLLGACETIQIDTCRGWAKTATVDYGDSGITVTPKRTVKQEKPFVIKLNPGSNDWKDKKVIVEGKSRDPSSCEDESWLDAEDNYNTRKKFKYCTPSVPADTTCEYEYSVKVVDAEDNTVLFVDPRVDVTY